jgi:hypothetical protein
MKHPFLLLVLALAAPIVCAEPAVTVRAVDLKAKAASDAKSVASLPVNTTVDLVKREGAWVQLRSGKDLGWAKLFDVRLAGANTGPAKGGSRRWCRWRSRCSVARTRSGRCWGSRAEAAAPA